MTPNRKLNIVNEPLVNRDRIILPPLLINLGLIKQFVKALDQHGDCFQYICRVFPQITIEKLKAGIFDGPQIRTLLRDFELTNHMNGTELAAWESFREVVEKFLGNEKSYMYEKIVQDLVENFKKLRG